MIGNLLDSRCPFRIPAQLWTAAVYPAQIEAANQTCPGGREQGPLLLEWSGWWIHSRQGSSEFTTSQAREETAWRQWVKGCLYLLTLSIQAPLMYVSDGVSCTRFRPPTHPCSVTSAQKNKDSETQAEEGRCICYGDSSESITFSLT